MVVALVILGILAALAQTLYSSYRERALVGQAISDMESLETRIAQYQTEFSQLPDSLARVANPAPTDPWGRAYKYTRIAGGPPSVMGQVRKDKNLVPLNTDYDLYSVGPDGLSTPALTAQQSQDDVVRANDGRFLGPASSY
jgi:general secretion pathway protein G